MMRLVAPLLSLAIAAVTMAQPPKSAPPLAFTVPTQGQQTLNDFRGKVVVLEFIYTTCGPCASSLQTLQKLQRDLGSRGFQAIAVAFNPNAEVLTEDFSKEQHLTIPLGWAFGNDVSAFLGYAPADRFIVPQTALIDRTGAIRYQTKAQGEDPLRNEPVLRQRILDLLQPADVPARR